MGRGLKETGATAICACLPARTHACLPACMRSIDVCMYVCMHAGRQAGLLACLQDGIFMHGCMDFNMRAFLFLVSCLST